MQAEQMMAIQAMQAEMQKILNAPPMMNEGSPKDLRWDLLFEVAFLNKNGVRLFNIRIEPNKLFLEAVNMFKNKTGFKDDFEFLYNAKKIREDKTINQNGLIPGCKIQAIRHQEIMGSRIMSKDFNHCPKNEKKIYGES